MKQKCSNTDNGNADASGSSETCSTYTLSRCGKYDDDDFKSNEMCCICNGGEAKKIRKLK